MPGPWDSVMKDLLRKNPQQFTEWLLAGGTFVAALSVELKRRDTYIYADGLYKVELDGKIILLHIEFQKRRDQNMADRLLEYNIQANREYGPLPVYSCVIYLVEGNVPESPLVKTLPNGKEILRFHYGIIKMWEVSSETILNTGSVGLLPLLTLTREGKQPETLDAMLENLVKIEEQSLLTIAYTLAGLVFESEADKKMLKRRFAMLGEILRDSWAYQEIMDEGREEGIQQGIEQGLQQGLQSLRRVLIGSVQATFPELVPQATQLAELLKEPGVLQDVALKLFAAKTYEEAAHILATAADEKENPGP